MQEVGKGGRGGCAFSSDGNNRFSTKHFSGLTYIVKFPKRV